MFADRVQHYTSPRRLLEHWTGSSAEDGADDRSVATVLLTVCRDTCMTSHVGVAIPGPIRPEGDNCKLDSKESESGRKEFLNFRLLRGNYK